MTRSNVSMSLSTSRRFVRIFFCCSCFCIAVGAASHAFAQQSNADPQAKDKTQAIAPRKILFLGNSITLHSPSQPIGWSGNWGMAASAQEKDFVHIVAKALSTPTGGVPELMVKNIADFERQYAAFDLAQLKEAFDFRADLVILAVGENVPELKSDENKSQFQAAVAKLLQKLKADNHPTIVVRTCFWPEAAKDAILKRDCQEAGGILVDIGHLAKDEANFARSERQFSHGGVASHPGDRGMLAIANAILKAIGAEPAK